MIPVNLDQLVFPINRIGDNLGAESGQTLSNILENHKEISQIMYVCLQSNIQINESIFWP